MQEELDLVVAMYGDTASIEENTTLPTLRLTLPLDLLMCFALPSSYPEEQRPAIRVEGGPNAVLSAQLERTMTKLCAEQPLGEPVLLFLVGEAQREAMEIEESVNAEAAAVALAKVAAKEAAAAAAEDDDDGHFFTTLQKQGVYRSEAISDRKSKFVAYTAKVSTEDDIDRVVALLRSNRKIASACHPAIWAYRFRDCDGVLHHDIDDDGETGAAKKIMFLMEQLQVEGFVCVVTRWFGGILLGPDRFKHIAAVSRDALVNGGCTTPKK